MNDCQRLKGQLRKNECFTHYMFLDVYIMFGQILIICRAHSPPRLGFKLQNFSLFWFAITWCTSVELFI